MALLASFYGRDIARARECLMYSVQEEESVVCGIDGREQKRHFLPLYSAWVEHFSVLLLGTVVWHRCGGRWTRLRESESLPHISHQFTFLKCAEAVSTSLSSLHDRLHTAEVMRAVIGALPLSEGYDLLR